MYLTSEHGRVLTLLYDDPEGQLVHYPKERYIHDPDDTSLNWSRSIGSRWFFHHSAEKPLDSIPLDGTVCADLVNAKIIYSDISDEEWAAAHALGVQDCREYKLSEMGKSVLKVEFVRALQRIPITWLGEDNESERV